MLIKQIFNKTLLKFSFVRNAKMQLLYVLKRINISF